MAAKKAQKKRRTVTIELDLEDLKKLVAAADALSDLANASIHGSDDADAQALGKQKKKPRR
jgi:hypothetical protein